MFHSLLNTQYHFSFGFLTYIHFYLYNVCNFSSPLGSVNMEAGFPQSTLDDLSRRGHTVIGPVTDIKRSLFGRGHVICKGAWWMDKSRDDVISDPSVLWGASEPRADGIAIGF